MKAVKPHYSGLLLLFLGLALAALGIYRGEVWEVLLKGTEICLECIGLR